MKHCLRILVLTVLLISCTNTKVVDTTADTTEVVVLPDGSIALLNSNSSIAYQPGFEPRTVMQKGEVFYVVEKSTSLFSVESENGTVEVLGTQFNLKSSEEKLEVEVEQGKVQLKVDKVIREIKKGQKALVRDVKKGIEVGKAEFKHKRWVKKMDKEMKKIGREIKKESKKLGKDVKKAFKQLKE